MKQKTDDQIRRDVVRELLWDHRTSSLDIRVDVNDGVVMLEGTVDSLAKKMAVGRAAHRVAGVLDLADEIAVKTPHGHTDEKIAHAVRQALEWDAVVPDKLITTTVSDGIVTLQGTVGTVAERADAQWVVSCLAGVVGVINEIQVSDVAVDADDLRHSIEAALERRIDKILPHTRDALGQRLIRVGYPRSLVRDCGGPNDKVGFDPLFRRPCDSDRVFRLPRFGKEPAENTGC